MRVRYLVLMLCLLRGVLWGQTSYTYRYWFDGDATGEQTGEVDAGSWQWEISVSAFDIGLHFMHLQIQNQSGNCSVVRTQPFVVMPSVGDTYSGTVIGGEYRYWFDGDLSTVQTGDVESSLMHVNIPVEGMTDWMHQIHWQVQDVNGNWSPVSTQYFAIVPKGVVDTSYSVVGGNYRYWFDGDLSTEQHGQIGNEFFQLQIPVVNFSDWLHQIHFQVQDEGGVWSPARTEFFIVVPKKEEEDKRITKVEYWVNDNSSVRHELPIDEPQLNLQFVQLIPVETQPLRSSMFEFALENGEPKIYAKNELNVIFHDASNYVTISSVDYVDTKVSQDVTNVERLNSNQSVVKNRPRENEIHWFKFDVDAGDSIAFRTNQASTIQIFDPSGNPVYQAEGYASISYGGTHIWENGTCYLAIHDVAGSAGTVRIDYLHLDKYDVVSQNVSVVGNDGYCTVSFQGNGFSDLYEVDLFNAAGDTIRSVHIGHESDATTSVVFGFSNEELGAYDAVFHFAEGDKLITEALMIVEATDIELSTEISFPSAFLKSKGVSSYSVKIHNSSNVTSYCTPVYIYISSHKKGGVHRIKLTGLDLPGFFDGVDCDSLTPDDKRLMSAISQRIGDTHYFVQTSSYDESTNDSVYIWSAYFFTDIAPESTMNFTLEVSSEETVEAWVSVPHENNLFASHPMDVSNIQRSVRRKTIREVYCCIRDRVECITNLIADGVNIANKLSEMSPNIPAKLVLGIADCVSGSANELVSSIGEVMCGENVASGSTWDRIQNMKNGLSPYSTLCSCASKILPIGKYRDLLEALNKVFDHKYMTVFNISSDIAECAIAFTEQKPECPPGSVHKGGISRAVTSLDPNDIYGYLSEAGSKFVADSVTKVNYTIEFENDPAFATAPAHTIIVKDTLDSRYFNLNSFVPIAIRVGSHELFLKDKDIAKANGLTSFVKTIDMRPEIYAIAQVEGLYSQTLGVSQWTFTSLDPMTMEPAEEVLQGILPVNHDGTSGIGEVMFEIGVQSGKEDGCEMQNRACITFDANAPILTPVWTNIVDAIPPTSTMLDGVLQNSDTLRLHFSGEDNRSGIWTYNVYVQYGAGTSWELAAENVMETQCDIRVYEDIDYGFMVLAVDSAGNVEHKETKEELRMTIVDGQIGLSIPYKMTSAGVGTLVLPFDAEVPEGLSVYKATEVEDGHIQLMNQTSIVAGTPLIVLGEAGSYVFKGVVSTMETEFTAGVLIGTTEQRVISSGYVLQRQGGVTGFYRVDPVKPVTVPAYRCWLSFNDAGVKCLLLDWPTDITLLKKSVAIDDECYDLEGRRANTQRKGIYIRKEKKRVFKP